MVNDSEAAEAAAQILEVAEGVEALCRRLREVHTRLPVSPLERLMLVGEEDMDRSTHLRIILECIVHDRLEPVARDLRSALHWPASEPEGRD
ncbi:MAG TPA: hypothetical protein VF173_05020 [Thermoanaerobaculia bacterium]|nr:hypothetical protein [Thermoanaerobaculia bacterium]